MALGFNQKAADGDVPSTDSNSPPPAFGNGQGGYYDGFGADAEKGLGPSGNGGRKMSRIDKPVSKSISGMGGLTEDDATDPSVTIGKQMELEAGNAIKYRTCSWKKVWPSSSAILSH